MKPKLWLPALFACSFPRFETKTVTCLVFLKLSKCTYSHFSLAWKSKYWYLCHFFMVFRVFGGGSNTTLFSSCCWHRYAVFSCVFHVFGFQFTDHPFGQLENVFRVWSLVAKNEENIINHKCDIHVRSEFSILRHKKHNLLLYHVVLRGWQLRMHTYTNKVRIQHKPGSLPVAAHWFFQMYLFWK